MNPEDLQKLLSEELRVNYSIAANLIEKLKFNYEQVQELYNTAWGWHGANLEE